VIGHLKSDGLLGRNYLKGAPGDQMNVVLSCAGHNLRLILRQLRIFCRQMWNNLWALLASASHHDAAASKDASITGIVW